MASNPQQPTSHNPWERVFEYDPPRLFDASTPRVFDYVALIVAMLAFDAWSSWPWWVELVVVSAVWSAVLYTMTFFRAKEDIAAERAAGIGPDFAAPEQPYVVHPPLH